jgi:hypothetical protein
MRTPSASIGNAYGTRYVERRSPPMDVSPPQRRRGCELPSRRPASSSASRLLRTQQIMFGQPVPHFKPKWRLAIGSRLRINDDRLMGDSMRNFRGFGRAAVVTVGLMSLSPSADATVVNLAFGTVDLNFTLGGDLTGIGGAAGNEIIGVSGTIGGVSTSSFTGNWPGGGAPQSFAIVQGLFTDINIAPTPYEMANIPGTPSGAFYDIDNIWYTGQTPHIDFSNGVVVLLSNGAADYIFGLCDPGQDCSGYGLTEGEPQGNPVSAVPEPATWAMLLLGFFGIGVMAYRQQSKPAFRPA